MFSKILVPLDGSFAAEAALESAKYLARVGLGEIELVRIQTLPQDLGYTSEYPIPSEVFEQERLQCQNYLDKVAEHLAEDGFRSRCTVVAGGDCARRIIEAAARSGTELIVLTSHGRSGLTRMMLGSIAEKVARLAHCPVMIVGRHTGALAEAKERSANLSPD